LAITALCLLFHDVSASELTDLNDGPALVKSLLEKIENIHLRELIEGMTNVKFEERFSI
jgi:hypothetical protein